MMAFGEHASNPDTQRDRRRQAREALAMMERDNDVVVGKGKNGGIITEPPEWWGRAER